MSLDYEVALKIRDLLNEIHLLDRQALGALLANRVPCNEALADHPTVQVGDANGGFTVGLLGILNGLAGVDSKGRGAVAAKFEEYKPGCPNLIGFTLLEDDDILRTADGSEGDTA